VLITLGLFFLRQRQEKKQVRLAGGSEFRRTSRPMDSELDLSYETHRDVSNHPYMSSPATASSTPTSSVVMFPGRDQHPSLLGATRPPAHYQAHSQYLSSRLPESENPFNAGSNSTDIEPFMDRRSGSDALSAGHQRKSLAGLSGYKPSRYVVHTDAEDDDLPANEDGVVELPPQYSATRGLKKGGPSSNAFDTPPL